MSEWICRKCLKVWSGPKICCGKIEKFQPEKHCILLVSAANGFRTIKEKWDKDPMFLEVSIEFTNEGCFSWVIIFNEFVERLKEYEFMYKELCK